MKIRKSQTDKDELYESAVEILNQKVKLQLPFCKENYKLDTTGRQELLI